MKSDSQEPRDVSNYENLIHKVYETIRCLVLNEIFHENHSKPKLNRIRNACAVNRNKF